MPDPHTQALPKSCSVHLCSTATLAHPAICCPMALPAVIICCMGHLPAWHLYLVASPYISHSIPILAPQEFLALTFKALLQAEASHSALRYLLITVTFIFCSLHFQTSLSSYWHHDFRPLYCFKLVQLPCAYKRHWQQLGWLCQPRPPIYMVPGSILSFHLYNGICLLPLAGSPSC